MTKLLTKTEFSVYALFYSKFGLKPFELNTIKWYFSKQMLKKIVFKLTKSGWIKRSSRGVYQCISPEKNITGIFQRTIENKLKNANLSYYFSKATAAEIWSDETYIQRSWEHSPIYISVLKKDLTNWKFFFKKNEIDFFDELPLNTLGEFIILNTVKKLDFDFHNKNPVEPLDKVIQFCEENKELYGYILGYFSKKYNKKTSAGREVLLKVSEAL